MSKWTKVELVVGPPQSAMPLLAPSGQAGIHDEPITLETSARVLSCATLFRDLLEQGDPVIPVTNFAAADVELWLHFSTLMCMNADTKSDGPKVKLPISEDVILRIAPFCEFCGSTELLDALVAWEQDHPSVRGVSCIEGLAGGTFDVVWSQKVIKALFMEASYACANMKTRDDIPLEKWPSWEGWNIGDYAEWECGSRVGTVIHGHAEVCDQVVLQYGNGDTQSCHKEDLQQIHVRLVNPSALKGLRRADTILRVVACQPNLM